MSIEVRVPQLPESVADATLIAWRKKPGDAVQRDENLVDLETDKVVLEVPAPAAGVLKEVKVQDGATVTSGQVLAVLEEGAVAAAAPAAAKASKAPAESRTPAESKTPAAARVAAEAKASEGPRSSAEAPSAPRAASAGGADKLAPSVRRLVEEHHLDTAGIPGSGRDGRITKADVLTHLTAKESAPPAKPAAATQIAPTGTRAERRVPMTRLRARIARAAAPGAGDCRDAHHLQRGRSHPGATVCAAATRSVSRRSTVCGSASLRSSSRRASRPCVAIPVINASVDGNDIVYHEYYDIGIAVSTDRGLIVPVLRDADTRSFADIEQSVGAFATRARDGAITLEELTGGTFTITNGGVFGSLLSTPILNQPQSAILGMHKIQERPVVIDGQVVVRPMMYLALTYDHRIIDGREAVQFLVAIKDALEDPARLLLQI